MAEHPPQPPPPQPPQPPSDPPRPEPDEEDDDPDPQTEDASADPAAPTTVADRTTGEAETPAAAAAEPGMEGVPLGSTEAPAPVPNCQQEVWSGINHFVCLKCYQGAWMISAMEAHMQQMHQQAVVLTPESRPMPDFPDQPSASEPVREVKDERA